MTSASERRLSGISPSDRASPVIVPRTGACLPRKTPPPCPLPYVGEGVGGGVFCNRRADRAAGRQHLLGEQRHLGQRRRAVQAAQRVEDAAQVPRPDLARQPLDLPDAGVRRPDDRLVADQGGPRRADRLRIAHVDRRPASATQDRHQRLVEPRLGLGLGAPDEDVPVQRESPEIGRLLGRLRQLPPALQLEPLGPLQAQQHRQSPLDGEGERLVAHAGHVDRRVWLLDGAGPTAVSPNCHGPASDATVPSVQARSSRS